MKTNYTLFFVFILTAFVAVSLTGYREVTKEVAKQNEDIFNKRAILKAVESNLVEADEVDDLEDAEVLEVFNKMESRVLDMEGEEVSDVVAAKIEMKKERKKPEDEQNLPLFIYDNGSEKFYILSVFGKGLWDDIWGYIALKEDLNTVAGAAFDHKAETPGLGAEIKDNPAFSKAFEGTEIFKDGEFVSINVYKAAKDRKHEVDGISGATITCVGVSDMLYDGIENYLPYLEKIKSK
ncbi:MAG: NADH:ubiquinone reductase (Na(+)-transporting) subunit C [Bacteroidetes bacterium]|nr:MAG: NADH:ubiquinone reductase (Na(+)-transporting) subunit C [Bacteroidota bacterium]